MNRIDISRLKKNRNTYLSLGFIIALSLTIMGFNYTIYDDGISLVELAIEMEEDDLFSVQRTVHPERKLPPPAVKPSEQVIDQEIEFIEVPNPEPVIEKIIVPTTLAPTPDADSYIPAPIGRPTIIEAIETEVITEIWEIVEQMPRFAGCEAEGLNDAALKACADQKLLDYIYSKVKYPAIARDNGIEGIVVASFVVEKDGSITLPKVVRDIGGGCGWEVLRIVKDMPDWIAGEQRGKKVRVQFNLPVKFTLQ